jgi:cytochrome d ubiquinol oxidase subunit II
VLFLARVNGLLFIINSVENDEVFYRAVRKLVVNSLYFLVFFLYFVTDILISDGFAVDPSSGIVSIEKFKYLHNLFGMPVVLMLFLSGVAAVLYGIAATVFGKSRKSIWFTGAGTVAAVFSLFMIAGFNNTAFYPSSFNLQDSLTIRNASSSYFTLKTMMYVSFIIPFVLAYIWYAWKSITSTKITEEEMKREEHTY